MAREARLHIPFALYHVRLDGNAGQSLFMDKQDGAQAYQLLKEGQQKFGHEILGFCFMEDHIHLAIQIANTSLSKIIHNFTFRYTRWFNKRYHRRGHLFVGRYKSTVIQGDKYLPDLIRYIHLTPVRLEIAKKPEDYLWSSHRVYLGLEALPWLNARLLLKKMHAQESEAQQQYQEFILQGMQHGRPKDLAAAKFSGRVFGDVEFVRAVITAAEQPHSKPNVSLDDLMAIVCYQYATTEAELASPGKQRSTSVARGVLAYLVKQSPGISFTDLAKRVQRDATTLSAHATRVEKTRRTDAQLNNFLQKIKTQILG